jgi:hypothetical protein
LTNLTESEQIVIKLYDSTGIKREPRFVENLRAKTYKVSEKDQIVGFKSMLENSEKNRILLRPPQVILFHSFEKI